MEHSELTVDSSRRPILASLVLLYYSYDLCFWLCLWSHLPSPLDHGLGGWFGREILGQASTVSWQGQRATDTSLPSILNTFLPGRGIGTFVISWFPNIPSLFRNFQNWINLILTHRSEYLTKQPRFSWSPYPPNLVSLSARTETMVGHKQTQAPTSFLLDCQRVLTPLAGTPHTLTLHSCQRWSMQTPGFPSFTQSKKF